MLLRRGRFDADLDEEMRLHRELREKEQIERGLSPKEAHCAVQRRFGNDLVLRGLGIGANTAIFTFVDASLLKPLPYPDAGKIAFIAELTPKRQGVHVHPFNFLQWQARSQSFEALALMQSIPVNTMGPEGAEQLSGLWTTAGLFRVFGVSPAMGRRVH